MNSFVRLLYGGMGESGNGEAYVFHSFCRLFEMQKKNKGITDKCDTLFRRERMGVEPTAARSARPAASFEDWGIHRDTTTPADKFTSI